MTAIEAHELMIKNIDLEEKVDIALAKGYKNAIYVKRNLLELERSNLKKINYSKYSKKWRELFCVLMYILEDYPLITAIKKAKVLEDMY